MDFQPDYQNIIDATCNRRPKRLPVYEHIISPYIMEKVLGNSFAELCHGDDADQAEFFAQYCRFFKEMTYDTVSFEVCITNTLPGHGAIMGGRPGPIQSREDFENYPWDELPQLYYDTAARQFELLGKSLPTGMKAIGGIGNGVFEISEDLVGYQYLCYLQVDDPELFADIYKRIGNLMAEIWKTFLQRYAQHFAVCRFGDDLGFKTSTLLAPEIIAEYILPQYKRIIEMIQKAGHPFLFHSCGNIFCVMDQIIKLGINAKHSNEDGIAPFGEWIRRYSDRIALFGGIDVDLLCTEKPEKIYETVLALGNEFRNKANGFALGSGNSIPDYVPVEGYLAMIRAAKEIRRGVTL